LGAIRIFDKQMRAFRMSAGWQEAALATARENQRGFAIGSSFWK
jgi:hypothetical protein